MIEAGSAVAVSLEGRRARARLDSAATTVDLEQRIAAQALARATRYTYLDHRSPPVVRAPGG